MGQTIPYHIGAESRFSLDYVAPTADELGRRRAEYPETAQLRQREFTHADRLYGLYVNSPSENPSDTDIQAVIETLPGTVQRVVYAAVSVSVGVREARPAAAYKDFSLEDLADAIQQVQWKQSVVEVGGNLLSSLICTHPFPNANHRTALGLLLLYLESYGVDVPRDSPSLPLSLQRRLNTYIRESKRVLTVRRNTRLFYHVSEAGYTHIVRKGGITIPLADYDLTVSNPYGEYGERHQALSRHLVATVLEWCDAEAVKSQTDDGLRVFAARL